MKRKSKKLWVIMILMIVINICIILSFYFPVIFQGLFGTILKVIYFLENCLLILVIIDHLKGKDNNE